MTKAFVSYSRRDTEFTRKLTDALIEKGMELWVDWKNIPPTVDWKLQIQKGVEEADTFLFLISPDSVKSGECAEEIAHAVNNNKRIITLLVRKAEEELPKSIKHINWIDFSKSDCFDESFHNLLEAINTDYEWVQTHSRLQVKALEWERHNKDHSLLLRGMELENMEGQLVLNASKEPNPTDIQGEFVLESKKAKEAERKAREKQRKLITRASIVVAVVMLFLTVWAFRQRNIAKENEQIAKDERAKAVISQKIADSARLDAEAAAEEAEKQAKIARINEIIGLAVAKKDQDYNQALLYGVEAYRRAEEANTNVSNAKTALLTTLQDRRGLMQILPGHNDWISKVTFSSDGKTLATASYDDVIILWDTSNPNNPIHIHQLHGHDVAISPNNTTVVTADYDLDYNAKIIFWDISNKASPKQLSLSVDGESLVSFTSDGSKLITGKWECGERACDSFIEIWDISTPASPMSLGSVKGDSAKLSSNDRLLTTSAYDENGPIITLWDISDPANPVSIKTLTGYYSAISPNNSILALSTFNDAGNSIIQLWDITSPASPNKISEVFGNSDWVSSIAFSPMGNKILIGGDNGSIFVWDITDPSKPWTSPSTDQLKAHTSYVSDIAFNPNGNTFSTGGSDGKVMTWDVSKIKNPLQLDLPAGTVGSSEDGNIILSSAYDEKLGSIKNQLWDVSVPTTPKLLGTLDDNNIERVSFSPDNKRLITTHYDYTNELYITTLWDISDPAKPHPYKLTDDYIDTTFFSPDNRILYTEFYDYVSEMYSDVLWDISNPSNPTPFVSFDYSIPIPSFAPNNSVFAYPDWNEGVIVFWDVSKSGQFKKLGTIPGNEIQFSADGRLAAISTYIDTSVVQLWDISDWKSRKEILSVEGFSPVLIMDRDLIVTQADNEENNSIDLYFWDISTPSKPVKTILKGHARYINSMAVSPDEKLIASASDDRTVILWDISDPKNPRGFSPLKGHRDGVSLLEFSADGSILASSSTDGGIFLWDVTEPSKVNEVAYFKTHNWAVDSLMFSDNGKTFITSDGYRETIFWDLDPISWIEKACFIANSNFTSEEWVQLFKGDRYRKTCENVGIASVPVSEPTEPVASTGTTETVTALPLCTATDATLGCPLVTWNSAENERDRFCIDTVSYTLYAMPEGTILTPMDEGFTCTDEGVRGGFQMYTCYSLEHPNSSFQASVCSTGCQVAESDQCQAGFGLDDSQSCCAPVSTDGCYQVTLEIGGCAQ